MKQFITFVLLVISSSCTNSQEQKVTTQEPLMVKNSQPITVKNIQLKNSYTVKHKDYTLNFKVEKVAAKNAFLVMEIKLYNNSYYVSPHDTRGMKGKLMMDFGSYKDIEFSGKIIANPPFAPNKVIAPRTENNAPKYNEMKGAIKEDVTYKQPLIIKANGDFEVFGRVKFVIEPRCTLEEIPLKIIYKAGKFTFGDPKC